ncbi:MAG: FecR domain-containing protein [Proteobacteria bacterium]|nr:FecR domain-containing protein [Pseudomonadota bacterium]
MSPWTICTMSRVAEDLSRELRRLRFVLLAGTALLTLLSAAGCTQYESFEPGTTPVAMVIDSAGYPSVQRNARPYILARQSRIYPGDRVMTDEQSLVEIEFEDGHRIRLGTRSQLLVTSHEGDQDRGSPTETVLTLSSGSLEVTDNQRGNHRITTSNAVISSSSPHFWMGYDPAGSELDVVSLAAGKLLVSNQHGEVSLASVYASCHVQPGAGPQGAIQWTESRFQQVKAAHQRINRL